MTKSLVSMAAAFLVAACNSHLDASSIKPGMSREVVLDRLGQPTRVVALDHGAQRLQYSSQPSGSTAWMIDLDAAGLVTAARQVLNERDFNRIVPGTWTRADIEREFGPPARIEAVASWNGPVMTYRWKDAQGADMFFSVYLDAQDVVQRAHPGMEFRN
jgi:hypothetical protein